jgi:branched-chain amino acid transport system permease protein
MFYRRAGIRHTTYEADARVVPIPFERRLLWLLLLLAATAPAWMSDLYFSSYLLPWIIWSSAALSLNVLMGWAGQVHLGFASVMAVGAYASVHLVRAGVPFVVAVAVAGLASALVGSIFGVPAVRVKGLYLAVSTLALQRMVDWTLVHVPAISGGAQATLQAPAPSFLGFALASDGARYYLALGWCVAVAAFTLNMQRTALGRAFAAVREKDYAAEVIGVNTYYYKALAFWISSFLGGVTGAVLAFAYYRAVTPEQFGLDVSIQVAAMVITGGLYSVIGSYFGAGFVLLAPIILDRFLRAGAGLVDVAIPTSTLANLPLVLYGGLIVGFLLIEPLGLAKVYDNVRNYLLVWPFGYARKSGLGR